MKITDIHARMILDSRGNPTVECDVTLEDGILGRAAVPSGASTGEHEALELRDGDPTRYGGKNVLSAVKNVNTTIRSKILGLNAFEQAHIDQTMIDLDGTPNKGRLGANAILAVSLANAHAAARASKLPLFAYIHKMANVDSQPTLPLPMINIINGGRHADFSTDIQEFMILPVGAETFSEAVEIADAVFMSLKRVIKSRGYKTTVGDEGGFAPDVKNGNKEALDLVCEAVEKAGYELGKDIALGIDVAASEFYETGMYNLNTEGRSLDTEHMISWLVELTKNYPIVSLEDGLDQNDWTGWVELTKKLGEKIQLVGDDLLVTNVDFLQKGVDMKAANSILVKVNQIGTLTEAVNAVKMAQNAGWRTIISHRSGETSDTTIADLAVGLSAGQIKTGSLSRTDRVSKYNQLLRIEEVLGVDAVFAGASALACDPLTL